MSPVGVTLVHAIVGIVYQLQEKEPWSKAISQVQCVYINIVYMYNMCNMYFMYFTYNVHLHVHVVSPQVLCNRLSELDAVLHRLADIRSELESSTQSKTAGTDALLPPLAAVLTQLLQVRHTLCK